MADIVCFHLITEPNGYLSNWYHSPFELEGDGYCCVEQYLMRTKALTFGDAQRAEQIMKTDDPAQMQQIGWKVAGYDDSVWAGIRQLVAFRGLMAKFSQSPILRERLLFTGHAILAECAASDRIWGIGLGMQSRGIKDVSKWPGRNILGFTLMMVREQLRKDFDGAEKKLPLLHAFAKRLKHAAKMAGEPGIICSFSLEEMRSLGLEMDCGNSFHEVYGLELGDHRGLELNYKQVDDPFVLGNALFSEWRFFTHWANCGMDESNVEWFELAAGRLEEITEEDWKQR